ncbi:cobalamin biosynthesis protein [Ketobacter sp. MCCC 1A13808]|nr:adenosylcobinamide-phosphate synthase CbiB [Ketobacter sp. MCCC 1A13808]MVF11168.1 cobalamin biosynthesis protein [Ketobacter sp. MCCC 1A13808]RLP53686.1 MAG: cobalamin biosynthesis protein [Ketobacter sp.]
MLQSRLFQGFRIVPIVVVKILIALSLDQWLGETRRWHPLVGFGHLAANLESRFNRHPASRTSIGPGLIAWLIAVVPWVGLSVWLSATPAGFVFEIAVLYLAVGRKSLFQHSQRVYQALSSNNLEQGRYHASRMVSRDCSSLDQSGCARATTESVLENGSDSIFGALFWFALLGAPGAVLYRLANTLDAMWGYRNHRFLWFGAPAAHLDDLLNLVPARLCALCYAFAGRTSNAIASWRRFARQLSSPNGGPVMAAGAGAINVRLGGPAVYHGVEQDKPYFGGEEECRPEHIVQANRLVDRSLLIFILLFSVLAYTGHWFVTGEAL